MTGPAMEPGEWRGRHLGDRTARYTDRDVILFALAVGAGPADLDLVFEKRLRVLPSFALTLAQWAPDVLGGAGAFDVGRALHGAQRLEVLRDLPPHGEVAMSARVAEVWDKGSAAVFDVEVESDYFVATWSLFAPGIGGFGGERGPGRPAPPEGDPSWAGELPLAENQALLYRLLGDRHHIHVDPEAAAVIGEPRPILHGLATLGAASLVAATQEDAHPAELTRLEGRFVAPVYPGERLEVLGWDRGRIAVLSDRGVAIDGATVQFS